MLAQKFHVKSSNLPKTHTFFCVKIYAFVSEPLDAAFSKWCVVKETLRKIKTTQAYVEQSNKVAK